MNAAVLQGHIGLGGAADLDDVAPDARQPPLDHTPLDVVFEIVAEGAARHETVALAAVAGLQLVRAVDA